MPQSLNRSLHSRVRRFGCAGGATLALLAAAATVHAQSIVAGGGATAASIQTQVDAFRAALGTLNPNTAGSFGSGRREINWDGVPDGLSAPNSLPANFFNVNSPRGVVFSTPGTGFAVSATAPSGTAVRFGNIDASYTGTFETFSAQRLFTAIASNVMDVSFFVPGSTTPALSRGFGSVFSDVDLSNTTSLQFFDGANASLGIFFAPPGKFSFLGVSFTSSILSRVRITSGNTALVGGATDQDGNTRDLVVMDDFIYAEPTTVVPEPATFGLLASGMIVLALLRRRRA